MHACAHMYYIKNANVFNINSYIWLMHQLGYIFPALQTCINLFNYISLYFWLISLSICHYWYHQSIMDHRSLWNIHVFINIRTRLRVSCLNRFSWLDIGDEFFNVIFGFSFLLFHEILAFIKPWLSGCCWTALASSIWLISHLYSQ